ncbi:hypothetical protein KUCAC02_002301 [Chaenocephalus aceratus]|uniref:Uncharacterized protein n=1 Tax=Chaenocephalus aceratus TaxID=36190 RepID=A0ACB9XVD6_CHAAC|nr:hypothetical protein KUCAC02_002301 [Chaenocephalus aceratus]
MYPPTITQAATVIEEEEEAAGCSSIPAAPPLCAQQLVAQKQKVCVAPIRPRRSTAAGQRLRLKTCCCGSERVKGLLAADGC